MVKFKNKSSTETEIEPRSKRRLFPKEPTQTPGNEKEDDKSTNTDEEKRRNEKENESGMTKNE